MNKVYGGRYSPEQLRGDTRTPKQLVGHELDVFAYTNVSWHPRKDIYVVPGGKLQLVLHADLGDLITDFAENHFPPAGFSYIQGKARFPNNINKEQDFLLSLELREVEQYADLVLINRRQELLYHFKLKQEVVTVKHPLEFRVTKYHSIDGKRKKEEQESVIPRFIKQSRTALPDPAHLSFVTNALKYNPKLN